MKPIDIKNISSVIVEKLKPTEPDQVILFGSHAYGEPNTDSDIDLYVVTKDEFIPNSWQEKQEIVRQVSRELRELRKTFPIDLIVHTKAMNKKFIELNSSFAKEIYTKGRVLL